MPFNFSLSSVLGTALGYKFVPKGTKKRKHRIRNYVDTFNRKYGASLNDLQKNSEMHISLGTIRDKETLRSNPELQRKKITEKIKKAAKADTFDDAWINHVEVMQSGVIYNTKDFPIILDTAEESCCGETLKQTGSNVIKIYTNHNGTKPNPLDIEKKGKKHTEPHIAPAHANVQSVISPNGGIYHPCHGYSQRDISIFDLFPGIVKYQSKKYAECDRVDYLVSLSEKSFCSVNNKPLKVNEAEMWYTALKYLFNDITLGQFDYMSVEMRYVIKQYMSTHKNRLSFLKSIKSYGFLRVISDVSKKLPREHIQKIMKQEREKKEKQEREKLVALQKQIRYQQLIQQQQMYQQQLYQQHEATHYADWYTGSKLKRTVSEPPPLTASYKPCIVDEEDDDIDDSWNFITEIVNNNKIPDLPPEREHTHSSSPSTHTSDDDEAKEQEEMNEIVDVYTMLYQTMKDKEGPDVSLADLTTIEQHDTFTPKVN
eukprot:194250_1